MANVDAIMGEVFEKRMRGTHQGPRRVRVFARWIDSIKAQPLSPVADGTAVRRGDALFHDATVGCASCHEGDKMTNNRAADVGTGKAFQVPSLSRIALRAPFMHNGCAATLKDRFLNPACGGGDLHGKTSHLDAGQIDDLVAYLESL
jgi:cytochrome c peroxidase